MFTMTISVLPAAAARPLREMRPRRAPRPGREAGPSPEARPARELRPGREARCVRTSARTSAPLRLTTRGRTVLVLLLVLTAMAWSLGSGTVSMAGTTPVVVPVRYVTVEAGQTLWSIAADVAPGTDPRVTAAQIRELNALPTSAISAGQQLAVPAGR